MVDPAAPVKRPVTERWWWFLLVSAWGWAPTVEVALALASGQTADLETFDWVLAGLFVVFFGVFVGARRHEARKRARASEGTGGASTATEHDRPPPGTLAE